MNSLTNRRKVLGDILMPTYFFQTFGTDKFGGFYSRHFENVYPKIYADRKLVRIVGIYLPSTYVKIVTVFEGF